MLCSVFNIKLVPNRGADTDPTDMSQVPRRLRISVESARSRSFNLIQPSPGHLTINLFRHTYYPSQLLCVFALRLWGGVGAEDRCTPSWLLSIWQDRSAPSRLRPRYHLTVQSSLPFLSRFPGSCLCQTHLLRADSAVLSRWHQVLFREIHLFNWPLAGGASEGGLAYQCFAHESGSLSGGVVLLLVSLIFAAFLLLLRAEAAFAFFGAEFKFAVAGSSLEPSELRQGVYAAPSYSL